MNKICKRVFIGVFILLFAFIFKISSINAASCYISVSAPSSAVVGQSFKVSVTVPSNAGSWEYTLSYDSSKVKLASGQLKVVGVIGDSKTSTYTFTALTSGSASFKAVNASVYDNNTITECFSGSGTATVNMKTQAEIEASYSKNNNLASLSVEGAELSPAFNSTTLEYTATLPPDTTKANVVATPEDKTAQITGIGEVDVVDGLNKIEITVTAQHGEKKTYVINLTVEELDPIKVKVGGKTYTIVRKKGMVENIPIGFVETNIKIKGEKVVAYKSEAAKLTLVALKDSEGDIRLFIYKNNEYKPFTEAKGAETNLLILDNNKKAPLGFIKTKFKYNKEEVNGYKFIKQGKKYYLVYARDLETGKDNFYIYDKENNVFQVLDKYPYQIIEYMAYTICALLGLFILIIIIKILSSLSSKQKKIEKYEKKLLKLRSKLDDSNYDIDDVDERPTIKKIEEDDYVPIKKTRKEKLKELEEARNVVNKRKPKYKKMTLEEDD